MSNRDDELLGRLYSVPGVRQALVLASARRVRVRGQSMEPALRHGEYVLFDTLAYRFGAPLVGDVVLATHPMRPGVRMIKRVAEVAADEVWLLGDNEVRSTDSRALGPFAREDVVARAWLVYWPAERMRRL